MLARLGVQVQTAGEPIGSIEIRDVRGRTIQRSDLTRVGGALAFDRAELHAVLADALPLTVLNLGKPYTPGEGPVEGEILIGADGIRSAVRGSTPIVYSGYTCWRGICENPGIHEAFEAWGGATRVGIVPLTRNRIYVFLVKMSPGGSPRTTSLASIRADFAAFSDPVPAALDALEATTLLHHDIEELDRPYWGSGSTLLIGDAAHAMTPNLGQGAGMAIEDAIVLPQVIEAADPAAALRQLRDKRVAEIQKRSRQIGKMAHWESPMGCRIRDGLLRATPQWLSDYSYRRMIEDGIKLAV